MQEKKETPVEETVEPTVETEEVKEVETKEPFVENEEKVDANKYNQALRKAREAEAERKDLEAEMKKLRKTENLLARQERKKKEVKNEEDEDDDGFWGEEPKTEVEKETPPESSLDADKIKQYIQEEIKPFVEAESNRKKLEKKKARESFYDKYPEYLKDSNKWNELLDEMENSIVPSGDYYRDLEKAHRIVGAENFTQKQIEQKTKDFATDANFDSGSGRIAGGEEFTSQEKQIMKTTGVSAETIKKMREKEKNKTLILEY